MAQTVRITITPEMEESIKVLHEFTSGTLNTTELIKMALGAYAKSKKLEISPAEQEVKEMDLMGAYQFYKWAKEDGTLEEDNIAHPEKLKPFVPKPYVPTR